MTTTEVGDASAEMDARAVLAALGVTDAVRVTPVALGWGGAALWRVDRRGNGASALRLYRPGHAAACRREVATMRAAGAAGVPVPEIEAEGACEDRPVLLLDWCTGRMAEDELRAKPWRAWSLGVALGQAQARLHAAPAPPELLQEDRDWIAWAGPDEAPLHNHLRAMPLRTDALLHLDFHLRNVMVAGRQLTGVLDWENARAGDPRADLARTFTIFRLVPAPPGSPQPIVTALLRTIEHGWRRGYASVAGPIGDLTPFLAWAGAVMHRDLAPKIGQPGVWIEPRHLDAISRQVARWKRRTGILT